MKRRVCSILVLVLIVFLSVVLTGCQYGSTNVKFVYLIPHDEKFHQKDETIVVQNEDGVYKFYKADLSADQIDTDLLAEIQKMEPGKQYKIIFDSNDYHIISVSLMN